MNVRTPARPATERIGDDDEDRRARIPARRLGGARYHPQQLGGWSTTPTTHAGAHRGRATYHDKSLPRTRDIQRVGRARKTIGGSAGCGLLGRCQMVVTVVIAVLVT